MNKPLAVKKRRRQTPDLQVLRPVPEHLAQARRNFLRRLDQAGRFALVQEITETRGQELRLAYDNVVGIGFGYKIRRVGEDRELERVPCITFVVSRKWRTEGRAGDPQKIPSHLWAYARVGGESLLCAVPTDVRPVADYGKSRLHAAEFPYGVSITRATGPDVLGGITCSLRRPAAPNEIYALGCQHVFSRMPAQDPDNSAGCPVINEFDRTHIGLTTAIRGNLTQARGFDAQLARVTNLAALRKSRAGIRFDPNQPHARGPSEIDKGFWIATPRISDGVRLLIWADVHGYLLDKTFDYYINGRTVSIPHDILIHAVARETLLHGDSGSPALRTSFGSRLMGMYLGGDGENAYFIPAWQLVQPENYGRKGEKSWTIASD